MLNVDNCKRVHAFIASENWVEAGNCVLEMLGREADCTTPVKGVKICQQLFQYALDNDKYLEAATLQWGPEMFSTEPESTVRVFEALDKGALILLQGASSMSKCLGKDTPVMLHDGTCKMSQHVKVGDVLMGDDSGPRKVLQANSGVGKLYRITPERGQSWVCNDAHILSLRVSSDKKCGSGCLSKKWRKGDIIDINIEDYLKLSKDKKNRLKQFSVGVKMASRTVPFDPYIYGCWLGDGGTDTPMLHTPDGPMARRWCEYFESLGYRIWSGYMDKCPAWAARNKNRGSNAFLNFIRRSSLNGEKFILPVYLQNSIKNRLKLLAGLIDSDGWVHQNGYRFVSKFESLSGQVQQLARSLGFAATVAKRQFGIKSRGFVGDYWVVTITGRVESIPTLEKKANGSTGKRQATNTSFSVEAIGQGEYYGFVIDDNHRFLLGDFTVTHNTYGAGGYFLLDYLRDPFYTTVKLAAVNEDHLKKNLFAHVVTLFRACSIPIPHKIIIQDSALWMGIKEAGNEFGISGIAFKQSQDSSGQFKGYKYKPVRKRKHPKFGFMSRLRVLGDEGQNWPMGPFKDFQTLIASKSGTDFVKVAVAYNPESLSQHVVQLAEPDTGWGAEDMERLYDWESKAGWQVCRLDAAKCENVIQKKVIYPGLQTYEGFLSYLKAGGDNSSNYCTFARGWPPIRATIDVIIPPAWPQEARGEAVFIETPTNCGAVDLAFMGKDSAQMAVGRWGKASGWRDQFGKMKLFTDNLNVAQNKPRYVLQIDQILPLSKHDNTVTMAEEIIARCRALEIKQEWLAVDKTGYGFGVHSHLTKVWGDVFGVSWNEKSTDKKILAEDQEGADSQCDGVMSEMWWAFRRWLEPSVRAILINPIIPPNPIQTQLTTRRYKAGTTKGIKVEKKEEYMARNAQVSPDEADSLVMLVHVVRRNSDVIPGLSEQSQPGKNINGRDGIKWQSLKSMVSVEVEDSLCATGQED